MFARNINSIDRRATILKWLQSIQGRLLSVLALVIVPSIVFCTFFAFRYADAERRSIEARRTDEVNNLSFLVDGEVAAVISTLKVLARAPSLEADNLPAFRSFAETAIGDRIAVLALLDRTGQQVMSTFIPPGQALPKRADMTVFEDVFKGTTTVTNVFEGTVVKRPIVAIAVPVMRDGQVALLLSAVIYPERFLGLFSKAHINPNWAAAVVDRKGQFVSRNLLPEQFIGQPARPELGAVARGTAAIGAFDNTTHEGVATGNSFSRSELTGWTSVVSVPSAVLAEPLHRALRWVVGGGLALALVSIGIASLLARRIARSVEAFSAAASALVEGNPLPATPAYISELAEVRAAFEITEGAVAARKRADEHVRFLLQELTHRSKNLLGVIQAVATRTARSAGSLDDFQIAFSNRLQGLAVSHDLLVKEDWQGASIDSLVTEHLAPFVDKASTRIEVDSPEFFLTAAAAQAIGLALHELATNANKYGALSGDAGKVTVICRVAVDEPDRPLRMQWIESGGPAVQAPTRTGFGRVVIEQMVASVVGGPAVLDYDPAGFRWTLLIATQQFSDASSVPRASPTMTRRDADVTDTGTGFDTAILHLPTKLDVPRKVSGVG